MSSWSIYNYQLCEIKIKHQLCLLLYIDRSPKGELQCTFIVYVNVNI